MRLPGGDTPALLNRRRALGVTTPVFGFGGAPDLSNDASIRETFTSTIHTDGSFDSETTVNVLLQRLRSGAHMFIDHSTTDSGGCTESGYYSTIDLDFDHLYRMSSTVGDWLATDDHPQRRVRIGQVDAVINGIDQVPTLNLLLMKKGLFFESREPYREDSPNAYQIIVDQIHLPCGETGDRSCGSLQYASFTHLRTFKSLLDDFLEMNDYLE